MTTVGTESLPGVDIAVVVVYFLAVIATSFYAMYKSKRDTATGYFLAGRLSTFIPVGASLFSSCIGSELFIGMAGSGAASGIAISAYCLLAACIMQGLGWLFTPVYLASGVTTLPEYMEKRFGGRRIQIFLAVLSLIIYILTKISVILFSSAFFIKAAIHWDFVQSVLLIIGITSLCTVSGGLAAVIYTDTMQTLLMGTGSIVLMVFAFIEVGGVNELYRKYMQAIPSDRPDNSTCGLPRNDSFILLRDPVVSDLPWPGFLIGATMVGMWYWCADQVIVQRVLSAKNLSHAQGGTTLAGYLINLPIFVLIIPGMISRVLYTDDIACATPEVCKQVCGIEAGCSNLAYPWLIMHLMPTGLRGIMVAVMMAAMVTSLTSIFNSASSVFTVDIYPLIRKSPTNREQMIVGRVFVIFMAIASILWIPVVENNQGGQIFLYIQAVQSFLTPPIATVFLVAILWPRANEQGAFWALIAGFISGSARLILEFFYAPPKCGDIDLRPGVVRNVNFLYFAAILLVQTLFVIIAVSFLTKPPKQWRCIRTTFSHRLDRTVRCDELPKSVFERLTEVTDNDANELANFSNELRSSCSSKSSNSDRKHADDDSLHLSDMEPKASKVTLFQRLGAPSSLDENGNEKNCATLTVDWLKYGATWFCGFSLDRNDNTAGVGISNRRERSESNIEQDAQDRVNAMVNSLEQTPKMRIFLTVNLVLILSTMTFATVFFSVWRW